MEAVLHALDRFAASAEHIRSHGVRALRVMTDGHADNAAKLEAAGGTHYLEIEASDDEGGSEEDDDSALEEDEEDEGA